MLIRLLWHQPKVPFARECVPLANEHPIGDHLVTIEFLVPEAVKFRGVSFQQCLYASDYDSSFFACWQEGAEPQSASGREAVRRRALALLHHN